MRGMSEGKMMRRATRMRKDCKSCSSPESMTRREKKKNPSSGLLCVSFFFSSISLFFSIQTMVIVTSKAGSPTA